MPLPEDARPVPAPSSSSPPRRPRLAGPAAEALESRRLMSVTLVSVASTGRTSGNLMSGSDTASGALPASVSADGRYVAFLSDATNLGTGQDANGGPDVFVRDTQTGKTILVSGNPSGSSAGNAGSGVSAAALGAGGGTEGEGPVISPDGRYVAFVSTATNLLPGANTGAATPELYVRDLQANTTTLVTQNAHGGPSAGTQAGNPVFSSDSRYVAFVSSGKDLTTGLGTAGGTNVFVRDLQNSTTTLVSATSGGVAANAAAIDPSISADGLYVTFVSGATNLAPNLQGSIQNVFLRDLQKNTTTLVTRNANASTGTAASVGAGGNGNSFSAVVSAGGGTVVFDSTAFDLVSGFAGATDATTGTEVQQVYAYDTGSGAVTLVSGAASGTVPGSGTPPAAAFKNAPTASSATIGGGGNSFDPAISADGRYVAFSSSAGNLVPGFLSLVGGANVYRHDLQAGTTQLVTVNAKGTGPGNSFSSGSVANANNAPAISSDGRFVGFLSQAGDLIAAPAPMPGGPTTTPTATTSGFNAFVRDMQSGVTTLLSAPVKAATGPGSTPTGSGAATIALSGNGSTAVFVTDAALVSTDTNTVDDVYAATVSGASPTPTPTPVPTPTPTPAPTGNVDLTDSVVGMLPVRLVAGVRSTARVAVNVVNHGTTTAVGHLVVDLFLSRDAGLSRDDLVLTTVEPYVKLKARHSLIVRVPVFTVPAKALGAYYFLAEVNPAGRIPESNLKNNLATSAATTDVVAPFVDLSGTFASSPASVVRGKAASAVLIVANAGNVPASGNLSIALTAGAAATPGTGDVALAAVRTVVRINAGVPRRLKLKFRVPASLPPGTYFLAARVNSNNRIVESDTTNNSAVSGSPFTAP